MRDIVIIGGTGTLGNALINHYKHFHARLVVFSRDELKQADMKKKYPDVKYIVGDIRDYESVLDATRGAKIVFHVAALKHVDILEAHPEEAYKTNVLGTKNSMRAALANEVEEFYFTSTDKAVMPVNVYGMTKGIAERMLLNANDLFSKTKFKVFRWGNILGSRGSVVSYFKKTLLEQGKAYVTDVNMTRYWMRIEDAVDFMLTHNCRFDRVNTPMLRSAPVVDLVHAIADKYHLKKYEFVETGIRPGEKIHEYMSIYDGVIDSSETAVKLSRPELIDMMGHI